MPQEPEAKASRLLDGALGWMATALPFGLSLSRAASSGQWRDDLPAVRDLGLVAVGIGGGLSTLFTQALSLVPLGPRTFRAAFGSALALAIAARLLYELVRGALLAAGEGSLAASGPTVRSPKLASLLAAIAALTAALSPTWQREATVGGGAMLATAATLGALTMAFRCADAPPATSLRLWVALGVLAGATFAESPPAALALGAAITVLLLTRHFGGRGTAPLRFPTPRITTAACVAALGTAALLLAPLALRPVAPRAWVDLGRALSASSLSALDTASASTTAIVAWTHEIGTMSLCIAAVGALTALAHRATRPLVAPFLALVALDALLPARAAGVLSADPLTALRSLAVAAIAMGSALGVHQIVSLLLNPSIPLGRTAAVLMVAFHLTLVALTSEEAGFAADRSDAFAAETWTDEALAPLAPRAAVLVRSPAIAWRLWAARLTRGERPDVLVIPVPLLNRGHVALALADEERELEPLLRDFALGGGPSEFALSKLADVRPLHVEFDAGWSKRLASHLAFAGLWLEYAPQPLGPSDRKLGNAGAFKELARVLVAIGDTVVPDAPTSNVVATTLRGHANLLGTVGETETADALLDRIGELRARDPFVSQLSLPYAVKGLRRVFTRRPPPAPRDPHTVSAR